MVDWQVELPGIGWLHSEGRDAVRLELDEQLLQRFPLKSPLVSLCSISAWFMSARQALGCKTSHTTCAMVLKSAKKVVCRTTVFIMASSVYIFVLIIHAANPSPKAS